MRHWMATLTLLAASLSAGGCALLGGGTTVSGEIVLHEGGTAQGTMVAVGGRTSTITLENLGPGTVRATVRNEEGGILLDGPLGESVSEVFSSDGDVVVDVALRNTGSRLVTVSYRVRGADGTGVDWRIIDGGGPER